MRKCIEKIENWLINILMIVKSLFAIMFYSNILGRRIVPMADSKSAYLLGNGPSLRDVLDSNVLKEVKNIFVVNFFSNDKSFFELKPENYVFIDSAIYRNEEDPFLSERRKYMINSFSQIDWEMNFYYPYHQRHSFFMKELKKINNNKFHLISFNTTPIDGPRWFRNIIYLLGLGLPMCYNVMNATVGLALNFRYRTIYLYGIEHSWLNQLYLNDKGQICSYNSHFYEGSKEPKDTVLEPGSYEEGLRSFAECLKSYRYLEDFAKTIDCKIINKTKNSFVDVFEKC